MEEQPPQPAPPPPPEPPPGSAAPVPQEPHPVPPEIPTVQAVGCLVCGYPARVDAAFCTNCGARLPGKDVPFPVSLTVPRPDRQSRLLLLVRWLAVLPRFFALFLHGTLAGVVGFIGIVVVLFTGHFPKGLFEVERRYYEHSLRVQAY